LSLAAFGSAALPIVERTIAKRPKLNESPEGFKEALGQHVKYEIDMFRFTFAALENSGVLWFSAGVPNALIGSFCTHVRNLVEFFEFTGSKAEETIGASILRERVMSRSERHFRARCAGS
jgi:hypothetical protein